MSTENTVGTINIGTELTIRGKRCKPLLVIPFYQRGYRWTAKESDKLIEDLVGFADNGESEYCLQPVVLQECDIPADVAKEDFDSSLRVVDGQQRLTTIAMLLKELGLQRKWEVYYDTEKKTLSSLLETDNNQTTINAHFRKNVRDAIKSKLKNVALKNVAEIDKLRSLFESLDKTDSRKKVSFLEYRIFQNDDDETEGQDEFLRYNATKTPLTSSELIRACYMVNASGLSEHERMEISKEWELIENTLRNEQFWLMLNPKGLTETPTRIDLLFALVMGVSIEKTKANPRIIFEKLDDNREKWDLRKVWHEVIRCFWWMQACFEDVELFNYLGWIRKYTKKPVEDIFGLWLGYPKMENFKKQIVSIIKEGLKNRFNMRSNGLIDFGSVDYDENQKENLRSLLVFINVLDCNHSHERFRFDLFKQGNWDIEHIDSQTPNDLSDDKSKREWLKSAWNECKKDYEKELRECELFADFDFDNPNIDRFGEMFEYIKKTCLDRDLVEDEKIKNGNKLGNLVLLNADINRSYKNAIFPVKRRTIKERVCDGEFIPPCTSKVFMKFYTAEPSKITNWLQKDFDGYFDTVKGWLDEFMKKPTQSKSDAYEIELENDSKHNNDNETCKDVGVTRQKSDETQSHVAGEVSFPEFMDKYAVVIPKIQRQYVQGRLDEYGEKCLNGFANVLAESIVSDKKVDLDFIYGIEYGSCFYPLDGQQRLTTLFLLAWLCGYSNHHQWKFRYDSRRATECFMDGLWKAVPPTFDAEVVKPSGDGGKEDSTYCSEWIKSQPWFMAPWAHDANVAGMLRMLDSLYSKLSQQKSKNFSLDNVKFLVNYLDASQSSYDQIFLKMNSRGRALTPWEEIKAVLDRFVPESMAKDWKDKINNTWQEEMWKKFKGKSDGAPDVEEVDDRMLTVVELALRVVEYKGKVKNSAYELSVWFEGQGEKERETFYKVCTKFFRALEDDVYSDELKMLLAPSWGKRPWITDFASDEVEDFYRPLAVFFASQYSMDADWMRFYINVAENYIVDEGHFIETCKRLRNFYSNGLKDSRGFLKWLSEQEHQCSGCSEQVKEEIAKAKQICSPQKGVALPAKPEGWNGAWNWKAAIIHAEGFAFFHGAIRFLFRDGKGDVNWTDFETKFANAKEYFKDWCDKNPYYKDAKLLRRLISYFKGENEFWQIYFDNAIDSLVYNWRNCILLNKVLSNAVSQLLMNNDARTFRYGTFNSDIADDGWRYFQNYMTRNRAVVHMAPKTELRGACEAGKKIYFHGAKAPYNQYVIGPRIELLVDLKNDGKIKFYDDNQNKDEFIKDKFLWHYDIHFFYEGVKFVWQSWDWIDMYDGDERLCEKVKESDSGNYTIEASKLKNKDDLVRELEWRIKAFKNRSNK